MKKITWKTIAILCAMLAMLLISPANGEETYVKSPSLENYVLVKSDDGVTLSKHPIELYAADMIRVSINKEALEKEYIEADVSLPLIPERLQYVLITEGWNMAHGYIKSTIDDNTVRIVILAEDLKDFKQMENLYMVFVCSFRDMK